MINLQDYKSRKHAGDATHTELTRAAQMERYLPLVRSVVSGLRFSLPPRLDTEDPLGYGTLGLLAALDRFDPAQGVKFETYAATRIRGYIIDQLRALDWVPRSARQRARQVERAREALEAELWRAPSAGEVAQ